MSNKLPNTEDSSRMTGERPVVFSGLANKKKAKPAYRWVGLLMIVMSLGFTLGTVTLLFSNQDDEPAPIDEPSSILPTEFPTATISTTDLIEEATATAEIIIVDETITPSIITENRLPTIQPDQILAFLSDSPVTDDELVPLGMLQDNPFTISVTRARSAMIRHTVTENETIDSIASRYNIDTNSIAWSNSRELMQRFLRPGDVLNIPPVDGVYIQSTGSLKSFRQYGEEYGVNDPFVIIDSPYNPHLNQYGPDDVPPDGTQMFIAGGTSFDVVWPVAIQIVESSSSTYGGGTGRGTEGENAVFSVTFQNGQPGSCAAQPAVGASAWTNPLKVSYRFVRGFTPGYHPGIDLSAPQGTPIYAANGGQVVFAGWNTFGYGNMVAIVHGPTMTVYAHMMDGGVAVGCGQSVASGQVIGYVGSTGNSSGPHLHFEILQRQGNQYIRTDPTATIGF